MNKDMQNQSQIYMLQVRGDLACFTSPSKAERDSYPVITPSAARGIFDSIMWKPAIRWVIHLIYVLNPISYMTIRRNELKNRTNWNGEAERDQRTTHALTKVNYIIAASFYMTDLAGPADNVKKFAHMFERRASKGQSFRDPFLGCREFPATVEYFTGDPLSASSEFQEFAGRSFNPHDVDLHIGTMVHDFESRDSNHFDMFDAEIRGGVMHVDAYPQKEASC
jgi:CRISPR-associated protein Cas5d